MNYPLGRPLNRDPDAKPKAHPIEGRPNWWRDPDGRERYIEPPPPKLPVGEATELTGIVGTDESCYAYFNDAEPDPIFPRRFWAGM